jgi:hypothetical protein
MKKTTKSKIDNNKIDQLANNMWLTDFRSQQKHSSLDFAIKLHMYDGDCKVEIILDTAKQFYNFIKN